MKTWISTRIQRALPEGMEDDWSYPGYLVDTETNTVVFCDRTEPEDASLGRTFKPLVDLLNEVAGELQQVHENVPYEVLEDYGIVT